jgi:3',5'-cyclic AMP phosphodiesterase CpdA
MKRRAFIGKLGMSVPSVYAGTSFFNSKHIGNPDFVYPAINTIEEAKTKEGFILLKLAFQSLDPQEIASIKGSVKASKAKIHKIKPYFFEAGEDNLLGKNAFNIHTSLDNVDVLVVWLRDARPDSTVSVAGTTFNLLELLQKKDLLIASGRTQIQVNFLYDKEIGEINPAEVKIKQPQIDAFRILIMADPQGGDPSDESNGETTRMKIHNAFIEQSVELANQQTGNPLFNIIIGDIVDHQGQKSNFEAMHAFFSRLSMPVLYTVGNHETRYRLDFSPGYNMEGFTNFFEAQKKMNGLDKLLYSFNLGQWHFVVWPDPLRDNFWETHPHYFDWLEQDLEKHKTRPTVFFHHVPLMPIGIDPMIDYVEGASVKKKLIDIIARHGNVKYAISGHVHIPLKSSVKTAVSYKGIQFINIPAAGYRPRAFGEEDFYGDPVQGIAVMDFDGKEANIQYQNVTRKTYAYPPELPAFKEDDYLLWLNHKWELPAGQTLQNGDFSKGLTGWHQRFVYKEDENPSNVCTVVRNKDREGASLFLFNRKRGFATPGQDRFPQTINRICQPVLLGKNEKPHLELNFKIDPDHYRKNSFNGAYVWIEAFEKQYKRLNLVYSIDTMFSQIGGKYADIRTVKPIHFDITAEEGAWHQVKINVFEDHEKQVGVAPDALNLDRLVINLGVWTVNDGQDQSIGVYFSDLSLKKPSQHLYSSSVGGENIELKQDKDLWIFQNKHVAGEHQYITEPA